jgi:N-acetylmuramoyl-L-alanine amidase
MIFWLRRVQRRMLGRLVRTGNLQGSTARCSRPWMILGAQGLTGVALLAAVVLGARLVVWPLPMHSTAPTSQPVAPADTGPALAASQAVEGVLGAVIPPEVVPVPTRRPGPPRVGLQVGHLQAGELPDELEQLRDATGARGGGKEEWEVNLDIVRRVAARLEAHGIVVDILPATIPPEYAADVFVAIHADGEPAGSASGFKAAHGRGRSPRDPRLVQLLYEEYGRATGLPEDPQITRNMRGYYAFSYRRFQHTVSPLTPAAILEIGFLTSAQDRRILLSQPDRAAEGIAGAILRFLEEDPAKPLGR